MTDTQQQQMEVPEVQEVQVKTPNLVVISEAVNVVISIQKTDTGRKVKEILELSCEKGEYIFREIN